jgi:mannose-6-phosphate isomerase-like protein (cupin superfamily)
MSLTSTTPSPIQSILPDCILPAFESAAINGRIGWTVPDRTKTLTGVGPMWLDYVVAAGEGRDISLASHRQRKILVKADESETGGAYRLMESTVPAHGAGAPLHYHGRAEEGFYVLEGALSMRIGEQSLNVGAGSFVLVPRGVLHAFDNGADAPARYLVIWSPAEAGRYFEELFELEQCSGGNPDVDAIAALRRKYDFVYPQ